MTSRYIQEFNDLVEELNFKKKNRECGHIEFAYLIMPFKVSLEELGFKVTRVMGMCHIKLCEHSKHG